MAESVDRPPIDAILQKVLEAVPFKLTVDGGVEQARQRLRELPRRPLHEGLRVENHSIDAPEGPIPVRVYRPDEAPPGGGAYPVTMFFHGGGFALGDLDTHDVTAREHAVGGGTVVVSVDYRLAPEHPFPAAVEDVWTASCWAAANAADFGADGSRLAVAGDSAGGTLAAVVAQRARDRVRAGSGPAVAFQLLWYPSTMWDTSLPSFTENAEAPVHAMGVAHGHVKPRGHGVQSPVVTASRTPSNVMSMMILPATSSTKSLRLPASRTAPARRRRR